MNYYIIYKVCQEYFKYFFRPIQVYRKSVVKNIPDATILILEERIIIIV